MKSILSFILLAVVFMPQSGTAQEACISGRVLTKDFQPVPWVTVRIQELNKTSVVDSTGSFLFTGLVPGYYTLIASHTGITSVKREVQISKPQDTVSLNIQLLEHYATLEEVVVTAGRTKLEKPVNIGKLPVNPMILPLSIEVVDRQLLDRQQVQTLGDAVRNVNGVYLMGTTGGYQEELASRGFAFGSNNTFRNGVRFNNSMMPEVSGIESIEVLKGGNAILFGTVGAGGILNIITRKPRFTSGGSVSYQSGSFGFNKPSIDLYGPLNSSRNVAWRFNTSYTTAGSFRDQVRSERSYINPSLLLRFSPKSELLLEMDHTRDRRQLDFGTGAINYRIAPLARNTYLNLPWSYVRASQSSATASFTRVLSDSWQWKTVASWRGFSNEIFGANRPNAGGQFVDSTTLNYGRWVRGLTRNRNGEQYFFASADVTGKFVTGKIKHTLLSGMDADYTRTQVSTFDFTRIRADRKNIYDTINIFGTVTYQKRNDIPDVPETFYTRTPLRRLGLYAQDFLEIGKKIKLLAGLRYTVSSAGTADTLFADGSRKLNHRFRTIAAFSPKIGILVNIKEDVSFFASYTNTYDINTAIDTFGNVLPPSIIDQYETGMKAILAGGCLTLQFTAYIIDNNNTVQSYSNLSATDPRRELGGKTRSKGLELDLQSTSFNGFSINAGYSYNDTRYLTSTLFVPGSKLRYNPNHTANLHVYYMVKPDNRLSGLNLSLGTYYIGERFAGRSTTKANPGFALIPLPAYCLLEAGAGFTWQQLSVRLKMNNILNELNYNVHDDNSVNPIAPRQWTATLNYRL